MDGKEVTITVDQWSGEFFNLPLVIYTASGTGEDITYTRTVIEPSAYSIKELGADGNPIAENGTLLDKDGNGT